MAEAEQGPAFAMQKAAAFLPRGNVSDLSRGKEEKKYSGAEQL